MKINLVQLHNANPMISQRIERFQKHIDRPAFESFVALIGTDPSTLAEIIRLGIDVKLEREQILYEENKNATTYARMNVCQILERLLADTEGWSTPPSPHLINV